MSRIRPLVIASAAIWMAGCQAIVIEPADGESVAYYFGLTRVELGAEPDKTRAVDVQAVGLWRDGPRVGVGYTAESSVAVHSDCQIVFFIRSMRQFETVRALLAADPELKGERLCLAEYP